MAPVREHDEACLLALEKLLDHHLCAAIPILFCVSIMSTAACASAGVAATTTPLRPRGLGLDDDRRPCWSNIGVCRRRIAEGRVSGARDAAPAP